VVDLRTLARRPDARFLILFFAILAAAFTVLALQPVNDRVVVPYTSVVARMSGAALASLGEDITVVGCDLRSPRFSVAIYNGCNGLITSLIFVAGVLAFPSTWRAKAIGVVAGLLAIQAINLIRIVALYYTGVLLPDAFDEAHVVVWQSLVILAGIVLWVVWARWASAQREPSP
jgi:exosortase H (IPTLxxWG-CTERM-specific)